MTFWKTSSGRGPCWSKAEQCSGFRFNCRKTLLANMEVAGLTGAGSGTGKAARMREIREAGTSAGGAGE